MAGDDYVEIEVTDCTVGGLRGVLDVMQSAYEINDDAAILSLSNSPGYGDRPPHISIRVACPHEDTPEAEAVAS